METNIDGFLISANFDSANLWRVERAVPGELHFDTMNEQDVCEHEFNCWIKPDCTTDTASSHAGVHRTWFYFSVTGGVAGSSVRFNIRNMNRQCKLYGQGMRAVFCVQPSQPSWTRVHSRHHFKVDGDNFIVSFRYDMLEDTECVHYLAFTYPFSYSDLQQHLRLLCSSPPAGVLLSRELLVHSPDGRRVDLLTISAEGEQQQLSQRPLVLLTARVHPGETPSSHVINGCLQLLLSNQPVAVKLRQKYVFKIIPMLNPDGVARGHYRTDVDGTNLNRVYCRPCVRRHPQIVAAKNIASGLPHHQQQQQLQQGTDSECESCGGGGVSAALETYVDDEASNTSFIAADNDDSNMTAPRLFSTTVGECLTDCPAVNPAATTPAASSGELLNQSSSADVAVKQLSSGGNRSCDEPANPVSSDKDSGCSVDATDSVTSPSAVPAVSVMTSQYDATQHKLFLYVDMHGHASKRGCFMYGNNFARISEMVECMLLPKLLSINCPHFDFLASNFSEKNMHSRGKRDGLSKEGSGRVAIYRATQLTRCYTLECNYNCGKLAVAPPTGHDVTAGSSLNDHSVQYYSPTHYQHVGECLLISLLDMTGDNTSSRLPHTHFKNVDGVRTALKRFIQSGCSASGGGVTVSRDPATCVSRGHSQAASQQ